ncbi:MAG: enoyl-CoA hydratase-related protein [Thermoleophilia bacterium]
MSVDLDRHDATVVLTLNRPEALNALSPEDLDGLDGHLDAIAADPGVRAVVITGAGEKAFCAGADIGHMREASALEARAYAQRGQGVLRRIETLDATVIAAVNGFALGGGCELSLACDIRIAAEGARFGQPEVTLGILPGWGGTQRLARATSIGFAKEIILTGRMVRADEALRVGLVTHVHPQEELLSSALDLAGQVTRSPLSATSAAKRLTNLALGGGSDGPFEREVDAFSLAFTTPDQREGMAAFLERRPPAFAGHETGETR